MARNIMDLLRGASTGGSVTQAIQDVGAVRATGKVQQPSSGPIRGNVLEEADAAALAGQQGKMEQEAGTKDALRQQQLAQQRLGIDEQRQGFRQQMALTKQKFDITGNDILENLERNRKTMSQQEQTLALEQVAATQRLGNDKYLFELQDVGRRQRLDTELGMQEAITKAVFANQLDLLKENNAFNRLIVLDDAEFKKAMAAYSNQTKLLDSGMRSQAIIELTKGDAALAKLISDIDIETALGIANADAKASNIRAGVSAGAGIASQTYQAFKTQDLAPSVSAPTFGATPGLGIQDRPSVLSGMSPTLTPYPSR